MNGATSRSDYVALIGRSYLEAVREVNEVKDVAQEEARRQNGGELSSYSFSKVGIKIFTLLP